MAALTKGQQLTERFTLARCLGSGGMGEVWLAEDRELHEQVALKVLHPQLSVSPEMVALLKNECRNTRRLVHPNIVRLFDFHRVDEWAFISMEYVDGSDFQQFLGADFGTVIPVVIPVIEALEYAHGLGIVHRDLKASKHPVQRGRHAAPGGFRHRRSHAGPSRHTNYQLRRHTAPHESPAIDGARSNAGG